MVGETLPALETHIRTRPTYPALKTTQYLLIAINAFSLDFPIHRAHWASWFPFDYADHICMYIYLDAIQIDVHMYKYECMCVCLCLYDDDSCCVRWREEGMSRVW